MIWDCGWANFANFQGCYIVIYYQKRLGLNVVSIATIIQWGAQWLTQLVEWTRDEKVAGLSLSTFIRCLVLVKTRKTCPDMTEKLLTWTLINKTNYTMDTVFKKWPVIFFFQLLYPLTHTHTLKSVGYYVYTLVQYLCLSVHPSVSLSVHQYFVSTLYLEHFFH